MKHGLSDQNISLITEVLKTIPQIDKAILYGSRAMGNFREGSDIDLVLFGKELDHSSLTKLLNLLDDLLLPYQFDLSIHHQISNLNLIDHIKRVGVLFYQNDRKIKDKL